MSVKPETKLIARVNHHLPLKDRRGNAAVRARFPEAAWIYFVKMNNPYTRDIADAWYSGSVGDLWIEYKWLPTTPVRAVVDASRLCSPGQLRWLNERHAEGRHVALAVGCPGGIALFEDGAWQTACPAERYLGLLQSAGEFARGIVERISHYGDNPSQKGNLRPRPEETERPGGARGDLSGTCRGP